MPKGRQRRPDIPRPGFREALTYNGRNPVDVILPVYEEFYEKLYHDDLTGLWNRSGFEASLKQLKDERSLDEPEEFLAIGILDVDRFKEVNDTYGHDVGDKVLQAIAGIVSTCLREGDLIARWGGDEFAVALRLHGNLDNKTHADIAKELDSKIKSRLQEAIAKIDNEPLKLVGISLGVEICGLSEIKYSTGINDIIDTADYRMYQNKHENDEPLVGMTVKKAGSTALNLSRRRSDKIPTNPDSDTSD